MKDLKLLIKKSILISYLRKLYEDCKQFFVSATQNFFSFNLDIGAGDMAPTFGWKNIDSLQGTLLSKDSILEQDDESVHFIYSSHFFEHIDDLTALNLLKEGHRVLKENKIFRIVVPNQSYFIDLYKNAQFEKLSMEVPQSVKNTWTKYGYDSVNNELLLFNSITAVVTNHITTRFKHLVDLKNKPPVVLAPPGDNIKDFYCGPPPNITPEEIKSAIDSKPVHDLCLWMFKKCDNAEVDFDKYPFAHKNNWNPQRFSDFIKENNLCFDVAEAKPFDTHQNLLKRGKREVYDFNSHRHTFSYFINLIKR